ncbi:protein FAR1-RELATED SEQUENCE 5-like [Nicotiana tabacum]|uniref:Protein FAR1-RELATED SEQUENCE n=2 Tax=Nicotiana tabacum TaxID=4097 RepID=A0A1S4AWS2_TOBAC|nr:PREDICTED: protein FAR1-RELATED SEQUENCE 5-like [Nicotiana tabacum]
MVVFGAALLYEETAEAFEWLCTVFFRAMSANMPQTFITDQDPAIYLAVSLVMPQTYYRLCIWHLEQNAFKHLNHIFRAHKSFPSDFSKLLYYYEYEDDFLNAWEEMLEKYDLKDNSWLKNTFAIREKWSMTYGRNVFSASMRSTQLSESFNGSLRGYLKSDLDIVQFFKHFQRAIDDKCANESKSNFDITQRISVLKVKLPLLIHAREIYNVTIFDLFEKKWERSLLVSINGFHDEGEFCKYNVSTHGSRREHVVVVKCSTKVVSCSCKLFEFSGVLCGHALKILDTLNIKDKIPDHYILKRWTKDVTNLVAMEIKVFSEGGDSKVEVSIRYRHLGQTLVQIASEASESKEGYELLAKYSNEIIAKLKEVKIKNESHESPPVPSKVLHDETIFVDSANVTKVIGLKKKQSTRRSNTRPKSFVEKTRKTKNKIQSPVSPPLQTVQHVSHLADLQAPCPPLSNATTNTG